MAKALETNGHSVTLLDPATGATMKLSEFQANPPSAEPPTAEEVSKYGSNIVLESLMSEAVRKSDAVVLGLHGVPGEDGVLQSVLELLGKPYTGSNSRTSAICIDKAFTKTILKAAGLAVPNGVISEKGDTAQMRHATLEHARAEFGFPMVIKPNDQGSTVGLTILKEDSEDAFNAAVELACKYSSKAIIEEFIEGRELTVAIIDNEALPIVEIAPEGGFYDYHHKYTKGMTVYTCPADLDTQITSAIQADALAAFHACGCRGYARIDYRLRSDGSYSCLEINTLPGMTATSLVPKAAAAAGISFETICEKILQSAFDR